MPEAYRLLRFLRSLKSGAELLMFLRLAFWAGVFSDYEAVRAFAYLGASSNTHDETPSPQPQPGADRGAWVSRGAGGQGRPRRQLP